MASFSLSSIHAKNFYLHSFRHNSFCLKLPYDDAIPISSLFYCTWESQCNHFRFHRWPHLGMEEAFATILCLQLQIIFSRKATCHSTQIGHVAMFIFYEAGLTLPAVQSFFNLRMYNFKCISETLLKSLWANQLNLMIQGSFASSE